MNKDSIQNIKLWIGAIHQIDQEDYINFCVARLHFAKDTIRGEKDCLRYIKKWLGSRLLTKDTIELFFFERKQRGISNADCNKYLHFFRHLDKYLKDRSLGNLECVNQIKAFPLIRGEIDILTKEQVCALINSEVEYGAFHGINRTDQLNFLHTAIIQVFAETGCRMKDIRNLKVKDISIPHKKVTFRDRKNRETTISYIQDELAAKLRKIIEGKKTEDYVFTNANGNQIVSQDFNQDLKRRAKSTGIIPNWQGLHTHIFRHTFITDLLTHGVPITLVAALAGHKDIQSTNWYFAHLEKPLREAVTKLSWVRDKVDPQILLEQFKESVKSFEFNNDDRFNYEMCERNKSVEIKIEVKT